MTGEIAIVETVETKEGEGASARRSFPTENHSYLDPFVLFDHFHVEQPHGFPEHPHRGFEAVTYMLNGAFTHKDSTGADKTVEEGGVQKVCMGSGVKHSEMPATDASDGLQLWVNLPQAKKDISASYQDAEAAELPVEDENNVTVKTVVGDGSPITLETDIEYRDIAIEGGSYTVEIQNGWNGFLYIISGEGTVSGREIEGGDLVVVEDGAELKAETGSSLRFVAVQGKPHNEEIRHHGPFVD